MLVSLGRTKEHLRVEFSSDDFEIQSCCEAAEEMVVRHIDRPVYGSAEQIPAVGAIGYDRYAMVMTRAVEASILTLCHDLYYQTMAGGRDGAGTLPDKVVAMLSHLRVWRSEGCDG